MKRVILTGATGFVGANLARRLLHDGHELHLLVRPAHRGWRIEDIRSSVHLHEVNFGDAQCLDRVVGQIRPDWVFHLAAHGAYASQTDLHQMVQTNLVGTINLVDACLKTGFEAFINTGSSSEYGIKDHPPAEDECLEPNSHYAVTKASATLFCQHTARSRRVHLTTLRLYSVYGPYEEPTRLVPTLILRGLNGELPPLVNPDVARDFVYTEDVNEAFILAASQPSKGFGAVYNVGTGVQTALRDVVEYARQVFGIVKEPNWGSMPNRSWDATTWVANTGRIRESLGWMPKYRFDEGLSHFTRWFREHPTMEALYRQIAQGGQ